MDIATPEINTTPLIDVLLVLFVLLIITVPIATHSVKLELPTSTASYPPPKQILIDIDFDGRVYWNSQFVSTDALLERWFRQVASAEDQPIVHVRPDRRVRFARVAQVLAAAARARVARLSLAPTSL